MTELVVMVGLQGAGKSTLVRSRFASTHAVVSKDQWPNARRKEQRQQGLVRELLAAGRCVAVDNTNASVADRAPLIHLAHELGLAVSVIYVATDVEVALSRNRGRQGRALVPDVGFYATLRRLVPPSQEEGFDRVEVLEGLARADA